MSVSVRDVVVRYGAVTAVDGVSLDVPRKKLTALLGPSGCGKTSLLRAICGLEPVASGEIRIGDQVVTGSSVSVAPEKRKVGLVFQQGALFPHLSVQKNVLFGLRGFRDREARAENALRLVHMWELRDRYPDELSGGEQQRVSLARSIAPSPEVVLLDEPFANLDATLRVRIRDEVRAILREAEITGILVTHDQEEALSIADVVAVMDRGRILQVGEPWEIYRRPSSRRVADFIGETQSLPCVIEGGAARSLVGTFSTNAPDGPGTLLVRPEELEVVSPAEGGARATLIDRRFFGHDVLDRVELADGNRLQVRRNPETLCEPGCVVSLRVRQSELTLFAGENGVFRAWRAPISL